MCSFYSKKYDTLLTNHFFIRKAGMPMQEEYLDAKIVGKTIADFRKKKGISQEVISGLADIGRTHLSAIERGERKPTLETLYRLCLAMGVKMSAVAEEIERRMEQRENCGG